MNHAERALANHRQAMAAEHPDGPDREWRITMHFYAAVHAVTHVTFAGAHAPPDYRHEQRRQDMGAHPRLRPVGRFYALLEALATTARYRPSAHPMTESQERSARLWSTEILKRADLETP